MSATMLRFLLAATVMLAACDQKEETRAPTRKTKSEAPARDGAANELLDAAIQAHGGMEKLRATAAFTFRANGTGPEGAFSLTARVRDLHQRVDFELASGGTQTIVRGPTHCWSKTDGPIVFPCAGDRGKEHVGIAHAHAAMLLLPIRTQDWRVEAGPDGLTLRWPELGTFATLVFDPENGRLSRAEYGVTTGSGTNRYRHALSDYREFCGFQMATQWKIQLNNEPFETIEITELTCGPVEAALFERPAQVKDGTVLEKEVPAKNLACRLMKGPYAGLATTIGDLIRALEQTPLSIAGGPRMIYVTAPPRVEDPDKFITAVCIPLAQLPPGGKLDQQDVEIRRIEGMEVLAAYGVGDYLKKIPQLMKLLVTEAEKRKLKTAGPAFQIGHMNPAEHPADQVVTEMMLPVK